MCVIVTTVDFSYSNKITVLRSHDFLVVVVLYVVYVVLFVSKL